MVTKDRYHHKWQYWAFWFFIAALGIIPNGLGAAAYLWRMISGH